MNRRKFLKVLGTGAVAGATVSSWPLMQALADPTDIENEFFIFIHAQGGWDVLLWSDPRDAATSLVDPPSTDYVDTSGLDPFWPANADQMPIVTFGNMHLGTTIGPLAQSHADKLTIVNGLAMSTVSHPDGTTFSATGRHLAGGRAVASSIDTMMANERGVDRTAGTSQLFPNVSIGFPSSFVGNGLDPRVSPLRMSDIGTAGKSLSRATVFDDARSRDAVTVLLSQEARSLAARSYYPDTYTAMALQYDSLRSMLSSNLGGTLFSESSIMSHYTASATAPYPAVAFPYTDPYQGDGAVLAAFAVEAIRLNKVRCVSFAMGGFDTHNTNYQDHAHNQMAMFTVLARLVEALEQVDHPNLRGEKLLAHTHVMVISDFCRTPKINPSQGRDHHPNNSTLIISPRFRANRVYGSTDDGVLPVAQSFHDAVSGMAVPSRQITPADVLATFLHAFEVSPTTKYVRDGVPIQELLR